MAILDQGEALIKLSCPVRCFISSIEQGFKNGSIVLSHLSAFHL